MTSRQTKIKALVAHVLSHYSTPVSLRQLHADVRQRYPQVAFSTVYRIVQQMETNHQVVRIDWRERGGRYEWAKRPHHHHLVCTSCQSATDISDTDIHYDDQQVARKTGFRVDSHSIELFGTCKQCQGEDAS